MSMPDSDAFLLPRLRVMRIVVLALVLGVVAFLVLALIIRAQGGLAAPPTPFLTYLALGFGGLQIGVSLLFPRFVVTQSRRQLARGQYPATAEASAQAPDDLTSLCNVFQTQLIIAAALLEGAAFFLLIAYLQEGEVAALGGVAVLLALLLVKFPTRPALESWLTEQQELLNQERSLL
ncbi:MAG TPA: hypothetical protein VEL76_31240 [Gemmataceae bacterium]|nr:hypothetical protein [Gemmataceae bacterium]